MARYGMSAAQQAAMRARMQAHGGLYKGTKTEWQQRRGNLRGLLMGLGAADAQVLAYQRNLNRLGFKGANGKPLVEDGVWGDNTAWAQDAFNTAQGYGDAPSTFQPMLAAQAAEMVAMAAAKAPAPAAAKVPAPVKAAAPIPAKQAVVKTTPGAPALPAGPGLLANMKAKWANLSTVQKAAIAGGGVLVVVGVVMVATRRRAMPATVPAMAGLGGWRRLHAKKSGYRQNRRRPRGKR